MEKAISGRVTPPNTIFAEISHRLRRKITFFVKNPIAQQRKPHALICNRMLREKLPAQCILLAVGGVAKVFEACSHSRHFFYRVFRHDVVEHVRNMRTCPDFPMRKVAFAATTVSVRRDE